MQEHEESTEWEWGIELEGEEENGRVKGEVSK